MKITTALKMVVLVLAVTLTTIFVLQNRMPVRVALPFERSFNFGLIYLLLIAYLLGVVTMVVAVVVIRRRIKRKRKLQDQEEAEELLDEE